MKKIFLYGFLMGLASLSLTSCNDDEDQLSDSRVTNYVLLTLNGDQIMYVDANSTFNDPGCKAELAGEDVTSQVQANSNVNTGEIGPYSVEYKAVNPDGFWASTTRTVYVGTPLVGSVMPGSFRLSKSGAKVSWSGYDIDMLTDGEGLYWVEDLMGGYYEQRAGYGDAYSMKGWLKVEPDNTVTFVKGGNVVGWGDAYDEFLNGVYDPEANTISYDVVYAGMHFNVILKLS